MDFDFYMPVKVVSGKYVLEKKGELISSLGKKCGIVTGKSGAVKSGALPELTKTLEKIGIAYCIFDEITENPLIEDCKRAGELFSQNGVDFIFGVGGGSALDSAKAIAIYAANPYLSPADIYKRDYRFPPLPVALIGTTSGTGSEVSGVSVLTNGETGRKKSISGADCYARLVFADPRYTESMPYGVTVSTCLDALSHAVEGFFTSKCTDIPMLFAQKAIPMLWECVVTMYNKRMLENVCPEEAFGLPDEEMRERLYYGSLYAGMVLNPCGTVFPHPLGYVLTENYGIPHGKACTAFMTELIDRGEKYEKEKFDQLFELMSTDKKTFCTAVECLTELPDIKMTRDEIEAYCSRWDGVTPNNFKFSPGGFTKEDAEEIFVKRFMS